MCEVIISKLNCNLSLKIIFVLAHNVDPDEMLHYAAFHLCLHWFPKCAFFRSL